MRATRSTLCLSRLSKCEKLFIYQTGFIPASNITLVISLRSTFPAPGYIIERLQCFYVIACGSWLLSLINMWLSEIKGNFLYSPGRLWLHYHPSTMYKRFPLSIKRYSYLLWLCINTLSDLFFNLSRHLYTQLIRIKNKTNLVSFAHFFTRLTLTAHVFT